MNAALELRGIVKRYGRHPALNGLDLTIPRGSIFGMVGSNGAGKTTAMALSIGLLHQNAGEVSLFGEGPFRSDRHAGRVALLPQDSRFPPHARVEELLRYYGHLQGCGGSQLETDINTLLDWVHLSDRRKSTVKTLSHGMNRRLSIAQSFLGWPELVLLDEPLNGLDPREAASVRDLIRQRRGRQAIVISSHHLADLEAICDTVAFIEKGKLVRQDSLASITQSLHRLTYVLARTGPGRETLASLIPDVEWQYSDGDRTLTAFFPQTHTAETLNASLIPLLISMGAGILEIRRGSDLETEYLRLHAGESGGT